MNILRKFEQLNAYICEADSILDNKNMSLAKDYCQKIIAVFCDEITSIQYNLDSNSADPFLEDRQINYLKDVYLLREKLLNYQINLQEKAVNFAIENFMAVSASESETEKLKEMLKELLENSETERKSHIVSKIFGFLADKGTDALIATLPTAISGLL